ncbi:iron chaperone [Dehalogenimonas etheniformans]|uniref:YdhG-like domain-containing protein n=1 Tax=Dehalogenimonas etheniformans TaxID=1536648 RepID=A0A2P5P7S1_9CHLR|nr:DUF1801 domain-containing protein [Dehalogenimonas etheniformans]PPD58347.1 hypothetical protein JP09_004360 [Dehalogenimonas etheniformans]QNT76919.1 DUF1801 domain-containing protein [Dehalogenimonas etheniformans]
MEKPKSTDEYIKSFPADIQGILEEIRRVIKGAAPESTEVISYGMPGFKLDNHLLLWFAAFKDHISLFPTSSGVDAFKAKLKEFKVSKGTIQFPLDKPIPYDLIREITGFRVKDPARHGSKY